MRAHTLLLLTTIGLAVAGPSLAAAQGPPSGHPGDYSPADIAYGARLYDAQCAVCHGPNGDAVSGIDFRTGKLRTAVTDTDITRVLASGVQGKGMPAFKFDASELSGLLAYLRNMNAFDRGSVKPGDAARGRAIFEGKGECTRCHRVNGQGPRVAPDLSDVGAARGPGSLVRTLMDPTSQMMPINRPVRAVTRDGRTITGRRLNEDSYTVQLIDDHEKLLSLTKTDLREYTILTTSPMPPYKGRLTDDELADLVSYLLTLKGR